MDKIKIIGNEVDRIMFGIKKSANAFIFIISDDVDIRNYFIDNISALDNIITIDDNIIETDVPLIEALNKKNVLLLNPEMKTKKLKELHDSTRNKETDYNALYYRLVLKREFLWEHKRSLIVVTDEQTIIPLLQTNQSLASASSFHFIDDYINEKSENVMAVSCDKTFVVSPDKTEEFLNVKPNPEIRQQQEEMVKKLNIQTESKTGPILTKKLTRK